VIVDVDFCAKHEHNTGIQRVVRETLSRWDQSDRPVLAVAWTGDATAWRRLTAAESDRVLHWNDRRRPAEERADDDAVIVPWNCRILLAEVPFQHLLKRIAAVARSSGNRLTAIGYDAIPLVSAEGQPAAESERFAHYLAAIKHADHIIGISRSAADEFRGFVSALSSQGLAGPRVSAIPLAVEVPRVQLAPREEGRGLVICVGSHEPRKNQDAVLAAAEVLYEEGRRFELVFVGGGSRSATMRFDERVARLSRRGFAVSSHRRLSDEELFGLFAVARFSVFVSLHEGFGLPVAESIALGVPVLTSNYGSLAEIAALGGCLTVDPRDDDAIVAAMRRMLDDDELIDGLRQQAAAVPRRGWSDYADELWLELAAEGGRA
jgi:glycosyltransferase involved in cell wall biosynthesis